MPGKHLKCRRECVFNLSLSGDACAREQQKAYCTYKTVFGDGKGNCAKKIYREAGRHRRLQFYPVWNSLNPLIPEGSQNFIIVVYGGSSAPLPFSPHHMR
ncbi:hypothetical protein AVEN_28231-1 [Araneus ventricosus]|uniref:Uncharacterized protein n=1 Tax=Araneus ventricosus TaxID=182803 RepID=A0A4Y2X0X8_ARAVE|nr:hypothetical protein AVEN_28231-1 [Araneus ventricosus]